MSPKPGTDLPPVPETDSSSSEYTDETQDELPSIAPAQKKTRNLISYKPAYSEHFDDVEDSGAGYKAYHTISPYRSTHIPQSDYDDSSSYESEASSEEDSEYAHKQRIRALEHTAQLLNEDSNRLNIEVHNVKQQINRLDQLMASTQRKLDGFNRTKQNKYSPTHRHFDYHSNH